MAGVKPYNLIARYWDELFAPSHGPMDASRRHVLKSILPNAQSACDLACGAGQTAVEFARAGLKTYAVDLSPSMCKATRERASREGVRVRVIRSDMRDFKLPEPVDLITCEYDALNHVPSKGDLRPVLECVARALRPGGYFYADVNNRFGFEQYWKNVWWVEKDGVVLAMRNGNEAAKDRAWCDLEWFVREGNLWRRVRERVEEVCWSEREMRAAFRAAGFDRVRAYDQSPFFGEAPFAPGCRTIYLARKSASAS